MTQSAAPSHAASSPLRLTLPDGTVREMATGTTGMDVAASIGAGLAKAALAVKLNGKMVDLSLPIANDTQIEIVTRKSPEALDLIRHDCAHVLAEAVQELFPGTQVTIGPTIENGFYYDFARETPFSTEDFPAIEAKMREIIARDKPLVREVWSRDKAIAFFEAKGEKFKVELIRDLPETEEISVYSQGEWRDLCRGPHMPSVGKIGTAFKLLKVAGAYWRGDHTKPVLQRIYGTAWRDDKELATHLEMLAEAEKRDHRKIGKEMNIFTICEDVGSGLPLWMPNGTVIRDELQFLAQQEERRDGYHRVSTPVITKGGLYYKSRHLPYYKEDMYAPMDIDGEDYYLRPMNCPHHHNVYMVGRHSYRDLPMRIAEYGTVFRYEASGALSGLMRTRGFTQNDAHIYCRYDQAKEEFIRVMKLHARYYDMFDIKDYYMRLSLPDLDKLDKYVDQPQQWLNALDIIRQAMNESGLNYKEAKGEAAFYGPKVDFMIRSAIGVEYAISTNQLDFLATETFDLTYTGDDGQYHPVYVIHRAPLGSHERFVAFLLEHYAGHFPVWLAPVQARIIPVADRHLEYAAAVERQLFEHPVPNGTGGLRIEVDSTPERMQKKIRDAQLQKIPYMLVVGDKEAETGTVAVRHRSGADLGIMPVGQFVARIATEATSRRDFKLEDAEKPQN